MTVKNKTAPSYAAPALEKGLDILEYLARETAARSQAEIAAALNRKQTELYRMLTCLEDRGYIVREEDSGKYRLTLRMYTLSHQQSATTLLQKAARIPMEELADQTKQACHLSVTNGSDLLVLMERHPSQRICLTIGEGTSLPLTSTTSGKLLLKNMNEAVREQIFSNDAYFRELSPAKQKTLKKQVDEIDGSVPLQSKSQLTHGCEDIVVSIGVPGTETDAVLAISYLVDNSAKMEKTRKQIFNAMKKCANKINTNLGVYA